MILYQYLHGLNILSLHKISLGDGEPDILRCAVGMFRSVVLYCNKKFQHEGGEPTESISVKTKISDKLKEPPTKSKEPKTNREV